MSVHKTATGTWRVKWRESGQQRSRGGFARRADAQRFDAEVTRLRQLGPLGLPQLEKGAVTVDEFVAGPFAERVETLAPKTRQRYAETYRLHVAPYLGDTPLHDVTVELLTGWQARLLRAGVGVETVRKANTLIGSILQRAVEFGRIPSNPQRLVAKPKRPAKLEVRPFTPEAVEAMRAHLLAPEPVTVARSRPGQRARRSYEVERRDALTCHRDAALVSVLAYAGLRPFEALRLTWGSVQDRTLIVRSTKTEGKSVRTVRLLGPLAADLAAWRLACGHPGDNALIFPSQTGSAWTEVAYQSWRRRTFDPAAKAAGRRDATPYTLRHSFASLLLHEGRSVIYVARQLGHAATETLKTYGHVMDEFEDAPMLAAEDAIRAARGASVPSKFPRGERHGVS